jgi:hypothetical protein
MMMPPFNSKTGVIIPLMFYQFKYGGSSSATILPDIVQSLIKYSLIYGFVS